MALTMPFINTLPAFDASVGLNTNIYVLGGEAITGYQFVLYNQVNPSTALYTSPVYAVSNDIAGSTIRSFPIQINSSMGILNNNNYKVKPITFSTAQPSGQVGNDALFTCYATPIVSLQYLDLVNGQSQFVNFENNVTVPATTIDLQVTFNPNDLQSEAKPNYISIDLYGVNFDGTQELITQNPNIYEFTQDITTDIYTATGALSGFSINVDSQGNPLSSSDSLYSSYIVSFSLYTIDNMVISGTYSGINCFYTTLRNSPFFSVYNLCSQGVVQINCSLTSLQGTSNIPLTDLVYPNNNSIDLNNSTYPDFDTAWVRWQNYFQLGQPYTLRIWGSDFDSSPNNNTILNMTSTIYGGYYITLKYNNNGTNTFISLSCGRNDSNGNPMYPYYIESDYIESSLITSSTNLFIGIQQQDGLFDIDFQILN